MIAQAGIARAGQTIISDKGYRSRGFEARLNESGITLIRPAVKPETPRPGKQILKRLRQGIESIFQTLKGQLKPEQHAGRTKSGVAARIHQRILALTATVWYNTTTNQPRPARSLTAYDHQPPGTTHLDPCIPRQHING